MRFLSFSRSLAGPLSFLVVLALAAPNAAAGLFYVDAVLGSDTHSGLAPEQAFKTIRHALTVATQPNDMIRLAAGDYSAATGEIFPLAVGAHRITGTLGSARPRIVGEATDVLFEASSPDDPAGSILVIDGVDLAGGAVGVHILSNRHLYVGALSNLRIEGLQEGVAVDTVEDATGAGQTSLFLTNVELEGCGFGVRFACSSPVPGSYVTAFDCTLTGNSVGFDLVSGTDGTLQVISSRIEGSGFLGVRALSTGDGHARVDLDGSLITANCVGVEVGGFGSSELLSRACTIAGNLIGVSTAAVPVPPAHAEFVNTIVWGNQGDLELGGPVQARFSNAGHGGFGFDDGNISADPLFRDAIGGDFRLSFGSPSIDSGEPPAVFQFSQDMALNVRPADGVLDAGPGMDMGCFEFATLEIDDGEPGLVAELAPGETLRLLSWGPSGSTTTLMLSLGGFNGCPFSTGFGAFFLNPGQFLTLAVMPAGPLEPGVLEATIPSTPILVGLDVAFQGLTTSALAPKGRALGNPAQLSIRN